MLYHICFHPLYQDISHVYTHDCRSGYHMQTPRIGVDIPISHVETQDRRIIMQEISSVNSQDRRRYHMKTQRIVGDIMCLQPGQQEISLINTQDGKIYHMIIPRIGENIACLHPGLQEISRDYTQDKRRYHLITPSLVDIKYQPSILCHTVRTFDLNKKLKIYL